MLPVEQPFKVYTDRDGDPLDGGYIYFGQPGQNPITAPVTVYWDAAGTQPAVQPLRTTNGYIMRSGTPANVFFDGSYSELVQDSKQRQVFYARTSDDFSIATTVQNFIVNLAESTGSSLIGFIQAGVGAVKRALQDKLRERISVLDFGADPTGEQNSTAAFLACRTQCLATNSVMEVPSGTYLINAGTNFAATGFHMVGKGAAPTLQLVGAGLGFVLDAGDAGVHMERMRMKNFKIVGNPNITHAFYSRGIVRSRFSDFDVRECSGSAFNLIFSVSNLYTNMVYSASTSATKPARGFILADSGTGFYCADNTFINCIAEDAIGMIGVLLFSGSGNTFVGGTFEACAKGIVIFAGCRRNAFKGVWMEMNATSDLENDGVLNSFDDCFFGSGSASPNVIIGSGQGTQFRGGYIRTANLQSTSSGTAFFGCGFDENLTGTLGITGPGSYKAVGLQKVNGTGDIVGVMPDMVGEDGSWVPGFAGDATAGAPTYSSRSGRLYNIGKMFYFEATMVVTSIGGAAGNMLLTGFPMAPGGDVTISHIFTSNTGVTFTGTRNRLTAQISPGANYATLIQSMDGSVEATMPAGQIGPGTYSIAGWFIAA